MKIKGVIPALATPLNEDESINTEVLKKLIENQISHGADGFYIGGATGEGLALRIDERKKLAETAVKTVNGRKICIVQVASTDFSTATQLARHAESVGADAISSTAPIFFSYSEDDVYNYYKRLADSVHIPLLVYYSPAANFKMSAKFAKRLFEIDNVTSIKWTSTDFYQLTMLKSMTNGEIDIMNGFDEMLLSGLSAGADGGIGSTYNFQLCTMRGIYDSFKSGDMTSAFAYQKKAAELVNALKGEPVIPAVKAILEQMGYAVGNATFPMKRYSEEEKQRIYENVVPYITD